MPRQPLTEYAASIPRRADLDARLHGVELRPPQHARRLVRVDALDRQVAEERVALAVVHLELQPLHDALRRPERYRGVRFVAPRLDRPGQPRAHGARRPGAAVAGRGHPEELGDGLAQLIDLLAQPGRLRL